MIFIKSRIFTRLCIIINNIFFPFFQNFFFLNPLFTSLFNFFVCYFVRSWLSSWNKLLPIRCCAFILSVSLSTITNLLLWRCNLISSSDSLLNRTSFLHFLKAFVSSSERLSLTSFCLVLEIKSLLGDVKNVLSSGNLLLVPTNYSLDYLLHYCSWIVVTNFYFVGKENTAF